LLAGADQDISTRWPTPSHVDVRPCGALGTDTTAAGVVALTVALAPGPRALMAVTVKV
jgi:hypothetical protein